MSAPLRVSNTAQLAKALGVSASVITMWARKRKIPALQLPGGHYRFDIGEVKRHLDRDTRDLTALTDASEDQIWGELNRRWKRRESKSMSRAVGVETRHQLHAASSRMLSVRDEIGNGYDKPEHIEFELKAIIAQLEATIEYSRAGQGGTSYLRDRNA